MNSILYSSDLWIIMGAMALAGLIERLQVILTPTDDDEDWLMCVWKWCRLTRISIR